MTLTTKCIRKVFLVNFPLLVFNVLVDEKGDEYVLSTHWKVRLNDRSGDKVTQDYPCTKLAVTADDLFIGEEAWLKIEGLIQSKHYQKPRA